MLIVYCIQFFNLSNFWNPDDGEQENEEDRSFSSYGRDGVIFLVDAGTVTNDEDQFRNCLSIIETTMMNRIIQSEKDLVILSLLHDSLSVYFLIYILDWRCFLQHSTQPFTSRTN